MSPSQEQHPALDTLLVELAAPVQVWSRPDGQVGGAGAEGVWCGDRRLLSRVEVVSPAGPWRRVSDRLFAGPDVARARSLTPTSVSEEYAADEPVDLVVHLRADATSMTAVRTGTPSTDEVAVTDLRWTTPDGSAAEVRAPGASVTVDGADLVLAWPGTTRATWEVRLTDERGPVVGVAPGPGWPRAEGALGQLLTRAEADAASLRVGLRDRPRDPFLAAGAPWYLTLFGRDSLLSAGLLRPVDPALAIGTLRALASRQGTRTDAAAAEEPGKILHELRGAPLDLGDGVRLPPVYYGSVDATLLWIRLLHAVWADGVPVSDLVVPLERALGWLGGFPGFVSYHDDSGHGLANQGWKDSPDAVRHADGGVADGPIALVEVQGYAYAAAVAGADLLDAHGGDGSPWRERARRLRDRFAEAFWVAGMPALALDATGRPVASLSSNIGHLLGTGILDRAQARVVADLLVSPALFSGYGVRTLAADHPAYDPVSYHRGSVWTHDTAIAVDGLLAEGFPDEAALLAEGLLRAAEALDFRLPELFSGASAVEGPPAAYPSSCRPQAWATASAIPVARALGGTRLRP